MLNCTACLLARVTTSACFVFQGSEVSMSMNVKKMHMQNLKEMVSYAENVAVCRRKLLVEHFSEVYDSRYCIERRETACDRCISRVRLAILCSLLPPVFQARSCSLDQVPLVRRNRRCEADDMHRQQAHKWDGEAAEFDSELPGRYLQRLG